MMQLILLRSTYIVLGIVWGLYYATTRVYYIKNFEENFSILLALEYVAMFLSIFFVKILKYKTILIFIRILPLTFFLIPIFKSKQIYLIAIFTLCISYSIAFPIILKVIHKEYPRFIIYGSIGFSIGSILMGIVSSFSYDYVFYVIALLLILCYSIIMSYYNPADIYDNIREYKFSKHLFIIVLIIAFSSSSMDMVYAYSSYKLNTLLNNEILYGILYGGISPIILLVLKKHLDKIYFSKNPFIVAFLMLFFITLYLNSLLIFSGVIFIILWQIPVYPFYEAAMLSLIINLLKNKELASGIFLTSFGVAGFIFLFIYNVLDIIETYLPTIVLLLMVSSILILKFLLIKIYYNNKL